MCVGVGLHGSWLFPVFIEAEHIVVFSIIVVAAFIIISFVIKEAGHVVATPCGTLPLLSTLVGIEPQRFGLELQKPFGECS